MISESLIHKAQNLQDIGINELAWKYEFILDILNILSNSNCIVLGGDIYKVDGNNGKISPTGDSWYFNKKFKKKDVIESYTKAKEYIVNYHKLNGDLFCYSVVYELYKESSNSVGGI